MKNNLKSVFKKLLIDTGLNQPAPLGSGGGKPKSISLEERELFMVSLSSAARWNGACAIVLMAVQGILLAFCLVMAWYLKDNPSSFQTILGGSLIVLVPLAAMFANVWKEKHRMDLLRAVLPLMTLDKLTELAFGFASGDLKSLIPTSD